jgi:hypothetical protein
MGSNEVPVNIPPDTSPAIGIVTQQIREMFNEISSPEIRRDWNPPAFATNIPNNCNSNDQRLRNTNQNCLRALIDNCNASITNQNNTINRNNCNALLNYTRAFVNTWVTRTGDIANREFNDRLPLEWEWGRGCYPWCSVVSCSAANRGQHLGPPDTDCVRFAASGQGCSAGFGAISRSRVRNCELMRNNRNWQTILANYRQRLQNITCPALSLVPTPPINCCNNTLNCDFASCIDIVQVCKQTINGESEISNATQCIQSRCPLNGQRCIAGTPGAGTFNWICQNNQWTRVPTQPPPQTLLPPPQTQQPPSPPPNDLNILPSTPPPQTQLPPPNDLNIPQPLDDLNIPQPSPPDDLNIPQPPPPDDLNIPQTTPKPIQPPKPNDLNIQQPPNDLNSRKPMSFVIPRRTNTINYTFYIILFIIVIVLIFIFYYFFM